MLLHAQCRRAVIAATSVRVSAKVKRWLTDGEGSVAIHLLCRLILVMLSNLPGPAEWPLISCIWCRPSVKAFAPYRPQNIATVYHTHTHDPQIVNVYFIFVCMFAPRIRVPLASWFQGRMKTLGELVRTEMATDWLAHWVTVLADARLRLGWRCNGKNPEVDDSVSRVVVLGKFGTGTGWIRVVVIWQFGAKLVWFSSDVLSTQYCSVCVRVCVSFYTRHFAVNVNMMNWCKMTLVVFFFQRGVYRHVVCVCHMPSVLMCIGVREAMIVLRHDQSPLSVYNQHPKHSVW